MNKSEKVIIFDTTLRDGEQSAGAGLTVEEKLRIAHQLNKLGVDVIEAGFAGSSQGDFDAVKRIANEVKGPIITSLARAVATDIDAAGEALKGANLKGVSIERAISKETQENIDETADSLNLLFIEDTKIKIGVDLEKVLSKNGNHPDNVLLTANDVILFPKEDSTISVLGEVQRETAMPYVNGASFREAVNRAGGVKRSADYKNAYVVYQNGDVRGTKSFLFFRFRPKLESGAIVIIPLKEKREKISIQETIGLTSAIASLTLLVRSLTQ